MAHQAARDAELNGLSSALPDLSRACSGRIVQAYTLPELTADGRGMLDENRDRPAIDAAAGRIELTKIDIQRGRIAAFVRQNRVVLHRLGLAMSLIIVSISLFFFFRIVLTINPRQLESAFAAMGSDQIALAFGLSAVSYLALTGYDGLALKHLHAKVPYKLTALASFTSYAVSFTLGFPLITGGAVRYWIYGPAGLSAGKVASLTAIAGITFWLGMGLIVGIGFLFEAQAVGEINHFHTLANQLIGIGVIGALVVYFVWVSLRRWRAKPVLSNLRLPGPLLTLGQMILGVVDVCAAAGVLYVLLPQGHGLAFLTFCALYSFACMLGIASNAPGGIGVFEATMLKGVGGPSESVLASLLLFRAIYYLIPFILAMALLGAHEAARRWRSLREAMEKSDDLDDG
jgi:glycosyltransferase 2 family protein